MTRETSTSGNVLLLPSKAGRTALAPWGPPAAVAVLTACVVLFIHPYRFGVDDHAIYIPSLKDLIGPELYPVDY